MVKRKDDFMYSEEIRLRVELHDKMLEFLENNEIYKLMDIVNSAIATKEEEYKRISDMKTDSHVCTEKGEFVDVNDKCE